MASKMAASSCPLKPRRLSFTRTAPPSVSPSSCATRTTQAAFKAQVKQQYPNLIALEDDEFHRSYSQFKILKATAWAVGGCGLLLGGLGVANTMIMSVFTRIREIAILRVNGFSNAQIAGMIFGESALSRLSGALLGLTIGTAALFALKLVPALHGYVDAIDQAAPGARS